jgi:cytochrome c6
MRPRGSIVSALAGVGLLFALASAAEANDPFAGQKTYNARCAGCHGPQGLPLMPGTPSFARGERLNMPDRILFASIKNGKNLCPSWRKILKDEDMLNVLAYIRTLNH